MLLAMAFFMMLQLQSFQKLFLVVSVAPLGLIGVVAALLLTGKPLGFVAILGVLALIGIIIRNSVILMAQIDELLAEGKDRLGRGGRGDAAPHAADPADGRGREPRHDPDRAARCSGGRWPIAMIGGIIAATAATLLFLPALYVAWFRIKPPAKSRAANATA